MLEADYDVGSDSDLYKAVPSTFANVFVIREVEADNYST